MSMLDNIDNKTIVEVVSFPMWKRQEPTFNDRAAWKKIGREKEWKEFQDKWKGQKVGDLRRNHREVLKGLDVSYIYSRNGDGVNVNVILNNCWKFPHENYEVLSITSREY